MNISPRVLMQQGGAWLAACRNWMLWNISFGSSIIWSDKTKLYQLTPYQMEEMCAHAVSAALAIHDVMAGKNKVVQTGVAIKSDYFPDKYAGEVLIASQGKAWELAEAFAAKTKGKCVNIYVVDSQHRPVRGYKEKMITNR